MALQGVANYVEVYVWRGKNRGGYTTTSSEGIRHQIIDDIKNVKGLERCGHVSMGIYQDQLPCAYISLWPGRSAPSVLIDSLEMEQQETEKTLPDVIIRLHHLNVPKMLEEFNNVKKRVEQKEIIWVMQASDSQDVTDGSNTSANCTSFVWSFLKIGGLEPVNASSYAAHVSLKGPNDSNFYKIVKCNIGQRLGGMFDGWWWTKKYFTPYGLVLRVASAAEAYEDDKNQTIRIMQSDRVAVEQEASNSTAIATAGVVGIVALAGMYLSKK